VPGGGSSWPGSLPLAWNREQQSTDYFLSDDIKRWENVVVDFAHASQEAQKNISQIGLTNGIPVCIIRLPFDDGREESRASKRIDL
jgi:hypothetical protein